MDDLNISPSKPPGPFDNASFLAPSTTIVLSNEMKFPLAHQHICLESPK